MANYDHKPFEWKTALNWRDMLVDAPAGYSPHWLGAITDKNLAAHCNKLYMQLRRDMDNGNGVSLMRDLVLRRIVWSVRILERIEQAIVHWSDEVDKGTEGAEEMLVKYMKFHTHQTDKMTYNIQSILVEMPPLKTVRQIHARSPRSDKVEFTETNEDSDDGNTNTIG